MLTLHADDRLVSVQLRSALGALEDFLDSRRDKLVELVAERVAKHRMHHQAFTTEECVLSDTLGSVDDLARDDKVSRGDLFAQRADGRERDNGLDAEILERGDVGSTGHFGRSDGVGGTVSRDESDQRARWEGRDGDGRGGLAPWLSRVSVLVALTHIVQTKSRRAGDVQSQSRRSCCFISRKHENDARDSDTHTGFRLSRWYSPLPPIHPIRTGRPLATGRAWGEDGITD